MSVTSVARGRMTYRAKVERLEASSVNPDGHPNPAGWVTLHASLPCYVWDRTRQEVLGLNETVVLGELKMLVPVDTDVTEKDRVSGVVNRAGDVYLPGTMRIVAVTRRANHLELLLNQVTGGRSPTVGVSS